MAGRKPKSDSLRFTELTEKIEKLEVAIAAQTKRLQGYKEERAKLLSHLIVGEMEEQRLNYPQVESLLNRLFKGEATKKQLELVSWRNEESSTPVEDEREMVQLIVRVTAKEKKKIYENMAKAQYGNFNSYAKKMMLTTSYTFCLMVASPTAQVEKFVVPPLTLA